MDLTQERLKELLHYDSNTGIFTRLISRSHNARKGDIAGRLDSHGYLCIYIDGKLYRSHRLAWFYVYGYFPDGDVDHKNLIRTDNWIDNLRPATRMENMQNKRGPSKNNKSGFLGVYFHKPLRKFTAQIRFGGRNRYLGLFDTPEEAHEAYLQAKREHHEGSML